MTYDVKQVILIRTDLNMRKGKMCAQAAHASMKVFFDRRVHPVLPGGTPPLFSCTLTPEMAEWVGGVFAKIVLGVESEADLLKALEEAKMRGLPCALITDVGNTEFHGVPTNTAVAIGPARREFIDLITGPEGIIKTKLL